MECLHCKKPIISKKELSVSYWWASSTIPLLGTYHKNCFDKAHSRVVGAIMPAQVDTNRLTSIKIMNYIVLFAILIILLLTLYKLKSIEDWVSFLNIGIAGWVLSLFLLLVLILMVYLPIRNLIIIKSIGQLR